MNIKPIRTKKDYNAALQRMEELWGAPLGTPKGDELDVLATLVDRYEEEHFPIEIKDPVLALKHIMDEKGIERKDLVPALGDKSKVSEVLNRKRKLSTTMIQKLHRRFKIPYEVLLG
ncbi:MAG: type II toxin-antitoxin system HigA family antitoxin [Chitinophagales bacterium]